MIDTEENPRSTAIYSKPGALLHEDHSRATDEERARARPAFLERIQSLVVRRGSLEPMREAFGLEDEDLAEYTVS